MVNIYRILECGERMTRVAQREGNNIKTAIAGLPECDKLVGQYVALGDDGEYIKFGIYPEIRV